MHTVTFYQRRNGKKRMHRQYQRRQDACRAARSWAARGKPGDTSSFNNTVDYNLIRIDGRSFNYSVKTQRYAIVANSKLPQPPPRTGNRYWLRASVVEGEWLSAPSMAEAIAMQREYAVAGPIYYGPAGTMDRICAEG